MLVWQISLKGIRKKNLKKEFEKRLVTMTFRSAQRSYQLTVICTAAFRVRIEMFSFRLRTSVEFIQID